MLEKNLQNDEIIYADAHFHSGDWDFPENWYGACCFLTSEDWKKVETSERIFRTFGVHPQSVSVDNIQEIFKELEFLEELCKNNNSGKSKKLRAIGEVGIDLFTEELKQTFSVQKEIFHNQIEIAKKYNLPIVIHGRKSNQYLLEFWKDLADLPGVLFHSFMGNETEAFGFLRKGINAYFSFGKQILNGNKKAIECVTKLPKENLLLETDAPFGTLKGQNKTELLEIKEVYKKAFELRRMQENITEIDFSNILFENLLYLYHE